MTPELKKQLEGANILFDERPMTAHERLMKAISRANALLAQCPPKMTIVKCNPNARKSNFDLRTLNELLL